MAVRAPFAKYLNQPSGGLQFGSYPADPSLRREWGFQRLHPGRAFQPRGANHAGACTTANGKTGPNELRTHRRRNGLQQFRLASNAWTPNAALLRTNPPTFSALERPSSATNKAGPPFLRRMVSISGWLGILPTARTP